MNELEFEQLYNDFGMLLENLYSWFTDILTVLTSSPIMFFLVMVPIILFITSALFGIIKSLFLPNQ